MIQYIIRRLLFLIPVLLVVGVIVFTIIHLTPGDPAVVILGESATQEQIQELREHLGLDDPLPIQFLSWMGRAVTGDLGESVFSGESVVASIIDHLGPTLSLALLATMISVTVAIPMAILAVWKRNSALDPLFMSVSLLGVSIPNFWLALLLVMCFSVFLGWLPVAGYAPLEDGLWEWLSHLILPAFVLSVHQMGIVSRMLRDGMLDVISQDFIRTARAKGMRERAVLTKHVLLNAMIPTITVMGSNVAHLLGGAIVIETIFAMPGIGQLVAESIFRRDYPVLQGTVLFVASVYVVVNLLVDLAYGLFDPRIRYD